MKNILCFTNRSLMAGTALQYAKSISQAAQAELVSVENPLMANLFRDIQLTMPETQPLPTARADGMLNKKGSQNLADYPDPTIQIKTVCTLAGLARSEKADLMVMGVEKEFGLYDMNSESINNLINQAQCPALFLPEGLTFKPLKKILVVMDQEMNIDHRFNIIVDFATPFEAEILFLQITKENTLTEETPFLESMKEMYLSFPYQKTSFHTSLHGSLAEGIANFISSVAADLVAIVPNLQAHLPYSYTTSLFNDQSVATPLTIPLLAIDCKPLTTSNSLKESAGAGQATETNQLDLYKEHI